ncbi:unnamed protein product [Linum trigynum]|uniref:Uncharacterized protein n=1 Tax=Linum trigynum TaxID=586398 RepID=A0AAV2GPM0_9ROSI
MWHSWGNFRWRLPPILCHAWLQLLRLWLTRRSSLNDIPPPPTQHELDLVHWMVEEGFGLEEGEGTEKLDAQFPVNVIFEIKELANCGCATASLIASPQ